MPGWKPTNHVRQGLRCEFAAPVGYRSPGASVWFDASMLDLVDLGLLMKTRQSTPPFMTPQELRIALAATSGAAGVELADCPAGRMTAWRHPANRTRER
jgi:hypothetical protein